MKTNILPLALLFGALLPAASSAQTVAYWRFESGAFLDDSSGNSRTLTNLNSANEYTLPATGAGSGFFDPVPRTGVANAQAAFKSNTSNYFITADNAAFTTNTLTLETLAHIASTSTTSDIFLAGHFNATTNQRSYSILLETSTSEFRFVVSSNGTASEIISSGLFYEVGKDYYFGVSADLADTSTSGVTFYLKNLTDGGILQTASVAHTTLSLHNSSTNFSLGGQGDGGSVGNWTGYLDEVRLSNIVLSADQLLVSSIPEPSSAAALASLATLGLVALRRRARA